MLPLVVIGEPETDKSVEEIPTLVTVPLPLVAIAALSAVFAVSSLYKVAYMALSAPLIVQDLLELRS